MGASPRPTVIPRKMAARWAAIFRRNPSLLLRKRIATPAPPRSPILPDGKGRARRIAAGPALFMLGLKICLRYRSMAQKRARMVATSARVAVPWGASAPAPLPVITPVWVAQIMAFTAQSLTEAPSG